MVLELIRVDSSELGTFGVLKIGHGPFALTLERPWMNNHPFLSCIPTGRYRCRLIKSPNFGLTYEVCDVPDRTHILFHCGSFVGNTEGCILVGEEFATLGGQLMLASSKRGFAEFMVRTKGLPEWDLVIDAYQPIETTVSV